MPQILTSPAYRRDGLLVITFDESEIDYTYDDHTKVTTFTGGDASACCHEQPGPNIPAFKAGAKVPINGPGMFGPGGGRIGAVLLSPFIRPGTLSTRAYNHYSLLRSIEDLFGLKHLGFAGQANLSSFGADIYTRRHGSANRQVDAR